MAAIAEMLLTLGIASVPIICGTLATYVYEDDASLAWRLSAGVCTGLVVLGLFGLCLASWFGLTPLTSIVAAGLAAFTLLLLSTSHSLAQFRADIEAAAARARTSVAHPTRRTVVSATLCLLVGLLVWTVLDRVTFDRPDGLYTGVANNLGDLPFHLGVITRFAFGDNFPPEHPAYAGARFTYSFLVDLVAAMFVRSGMSIRGAMLLENFVLAISLIVLLHRWAFALTRDRAAAGLTVALVLMSGGLGWLLLVQELTKSGGSFTVLTRLPHDYTVMNGTDWRWGNMVTALLVPQRSLLFGLPVAIIVFTLWWKSFEDAAVVDAGSRPMPAEMNLATRRMVAAGILTGLLPLAHAHTYAVVMAMGGCFALILGGLRLWVVFFAASLALSLPQLIWLAGGTSIETERFVGWHLGWDHGNQNILWFWLKNTGALIPLLVVAALWRGAGAPVPRPLWRVYLPFTLCFLIPNVVMLAPWIWTTSRCSSIGIWPRRPSSPWCSSTSGGVGAFFASLLRRSPYP